MKLSQALEQGPVFAFNIDSWPTLKAVAAAVAESRQPTIVAVSEGETNFWGLPQFYALVDSFKKQGLPLFLNLDHGHSPVLINQALELGFDMVHVDFSQLPLAENMRQSRLMVAKAHERHILVEVEPDEKLTRANDLKELIEASGADLVAIFAGNKHGYDPRHEERLDISQIRRLKKVAGSVYLTLHGGSGVNFADLEQALRENLIQKININSRLRYILRREWSKILTENDSFKYYQLARPVVVALEKQIKTYFHLLR